MNLLNLLKYYMNTIQDRLILSKTNDITDLKNAPQKTRWIPEDHKNSKMLVVTNFISHKTQLSYIEY